MVHPRVFVVSGGTGSSGEQLARTALAQFGGLDVPLTIVPAVRTREDVLAVIDRARTSDALVIHTLVDRDLRDILCQAAAVRGVEELDLMGPELERLAALLGLQPLGIPGLYSKVHEAYFRRIEAIDYTVRHDDGRFHEELDTAEIVLIGVSRAGKTPLSMYLAMRGFKTANIPLMKEMQPPQELFEVPKGRVVGLTIDPERLLLYRRQRQDGLGGGAPTAYSDPREVRQDLEHANAVFRKGRFATVDVTSKPIEESANEVVSIVARQTGLDTVSRTDF